MKPLGLHVVHVMSNHVLHICIYNNLLTVIYSTILPRMSPRQSLGDDSLQNILAGEMFFCCCFTHTGEHAWAQISVIGLIVTIPVCSCGIGDMWPWSYWHSDTGWRYQRHPAHSQTFIPRQSSVLLRLFQAWQVICAVLSPYGGMEIRKMPEKMLLMCVFKEFSDFIYTL